MYYPELRTDYVTETLPEHAKPKVGFINAKGNQKIIESKGIKKGSKVNIVGFGDLVLKVKVIEERTRRIRVEGKRGAYSPSQVTVVKRSKK